MEAFCSTFAFSLLLSQIELFLFSLRGPEGTAASSTCAGGAQGGAMCNMNSQNCNSCGGRWCYKRDECHHFQCPARSDISKAEMDLRNEKLCALQTKLKAKGYQINLQESSHYEHRGYATYESSIWPKPATCLRLEAGSEIHMGMLNYMTTERVDEEGVSFYPISIDDHVSFGQRCVALSGGYVGKSSTIGAETFLPIGWRHNIW